MAEVVRVPVKVLRKPITYFTEKNYFNGGWYAFPKPKDEEPPKIKGLKKSQRILWCPWCDEWTIYQKNEDRWVCTGICGFGNNYEYYVRQYNNLWFEDVPLSAIKNMTIPAPSKRR